jgi:hypothetical protein
MDYPQVEDLKAAIKEAAEIIAASNLTLAETIRARDAAMFKGVDATSIMFINFRKRLSQK